MTQITTILRLAARIADLRAQGHAIRTVMVSRHGKRLAEYRMSRHGA